MKRQTLCLLTLAATAACFAAGAATGPQAPKAAALALVSAVKTGDLQTALACFITETEDQKSAAERIMLERLPWAAIERSLKEKFGPQTRIENSDADYYTRETARIESGVVFTDGDKAKLFLGSQGKPPIGLGKADIELVRTAAGWKLDASNTGFHHAEKDLEKPRLRYALAREIVADIASGKFTTSQAAVSNARARFMALEKSFEEKP